MENNVASRRYYADPTADAAIGNIMREERAEKRKREAELKRTLLKRTLIEDIRTVLKEAKRMGCETVRFNDVPIENLELVLSALRAYKR